MVDERIVLDFYLEEIDRGNISFLKDKDEYNPIIKRHIRDLKNSTDMHDKIQIAKGLWKILFEASLSHIDYDRNGYDELFKFFDEYVEFEELIFASDAFYRDHTIHCLWVYFLGEYLYRKPEYKFIFKYMFEDFTSDKILLEDIIQVNRPEIFSQVHYILKEAEKITSHEDSMRCLVALTHDLGYPLKKIRKINNCISKILPRFSIESFNEFDFSFNNTQMKFIDEFIEYISTEIKVDWNSHEENFDLIMKLMKFDEMGNRLGLNIEEVEKLSHKDLKKVKSLFSFKVSRKIDRSKCLRYSNDFERYEHGILSAFLLMKTLGFFREVNLKISKADDIPITDIDIYKVISSVAILSAIADHTSTGYQIKSINNISSFLTFVDELEEFSRITRANKNREFINEFCKTDIYAADNILNVDFIFDNNKAENLDPQMAFKGRCKKLLKLLNIRDLDEDFKLRLRCIGKLENNNNIYSIDVRRKYVNITINDEEMIIPEYLNSREFYTREQYMKL